MNEMITAVKDLIAPELLVLVPVLYLIGMGIKKSAFIPDKLIPMLLGICGVVLSAIWIFGNGAENIAAAVFASLTQGVLCAGASVYANQIIKQSGRDKS